MGGNGPMCFRQLPVRYLSLVVIQQVQRSIDVGTIDQERWTWVDVCSNRMEDRVKLRLGRATEGAPTTGCVMRNQKRENLAQLRKCSLPHFQSVSVLFPLRSLPDPLHSVLILTIYIRRMAPGQSALAEGQKSASPFLRSFLFSIRLFTAS